MLFFLVLQAEKIGNSMENLIFKSGHIAPHGKDYSEILNKINI